VRRRWLCCLLLLAGCGGDTAASADAVPERCPEADRGATQLYDPVNAEKVELWPDSLLTVADDSSPTGQRLDASKDKTAWIGFISPLLEDIFPQASVASGFARNGGMLFRFDEPLEGLPTTVEESLTSEVAQLIDLASGERRPFEVELWAQGRIVILQPVVTLEANTRHLAVITSAATSGGSCVASSPTMAELLSGRSPDARFAPVAPRYAEAIAEAGLAAEDLVAASVFTTHADHLRVLEAAEHAGAQSYDWVTEPVCDPPGAFRRCDGVFTGRDYRRVGEVSAGPVQATPVAGWELGVSIGLPDTPGPHPVVVFGHGLAGSRSSVHQLDAIAEQLDIVIVASDALKHGDHPTSTGGGGAPEFLGINLGEGPAPPLDTIALKSNFNQTTLDRVQLVKLLKDAPDLDGDGNADVDPNRIGYWGISLGGLLGPGLTALSPDVQTAILSVGGGKLTNFVRDSSEVEEILGLLAGLLGGPDEFNALLAVAQSMVDGGDPAMWGAHVLRDRLLGEAPHLLLPLAMSDAVVPPSTGRALARSLALPHMAPVAEAVPPLEEVSGPLSLNVAGKTVGYFQFDRMNDPPVPASHGLPGSPEALLQAEHFLSTWLAGAPEIIDPYAELGTPPL
jgi:dienelactone hydrolase